LEADIDFPDEETGASDLSGISKSLKAIHNELKGLIESSGLGRVLREGVHVVICGKPNAGKSSLLNALLKQERSIVTPIAGTTRDTIEEIIDIKGIPVRIMDTAGILEPRDLIEKKAVQRSSRCINSADLVLLLFDGSRRLDRNDEILIKKLRQKAIIAIINKIDLRQKIAGGRLKKSFNNIISLSAKKFKNIDLLENAIADLVYNGRVSPQEPVLVGNLRHIEALKAAQKLIAGSLDSLDNKLSLEFIAQDVKDALGHLDALLGRAFSDDLLDNIFSRFCIGK
jgi:tRNA modification GTPase